MTDQLEQYRQLRRLLNPSIKGPGVDAVLEALATNTEHLISNVEAVSDQLFISTASGTYLDSLLSGKNLTRPPEIGLTDSIFRQLGVAVTKTKQIRNQIHEVIRVMYGYEYIQAYSPSTISEPYSLADGWSLDFSFDGQETITTTFYTKDFENILNATAQEVADAITKSIKNQGKKGSAIVRNDGSGNVVVLVSNTMGASSSVTVLGGRAQNSLKFQQIRPTSSEPTTQWTLENSPSGSVRMIWTGGLNPNLGRVKKDDYVNIFSPGFLIENSGTFTIDSVQGGSVGQAYVEFKNPIFTPQTTLQGTSDGVLFFEPVKRKTDSNLMYASVFQSSARVLQIYLPAITKVLRRELKGSAHLQNVGEQNYLGPYVYDTDKPYTIGQINGNLTQKVDGQVVFLDDASNFPDSQGYLVFNYGFKNEEGPVPYLSRPSNNSILLSPQYKIKNRHLSGSNVSLIYENAPHKVDTGGGDYDFIVTDVASGRVFTQQIIESITATGIVLSITIIYPSEKGLGKNEKEYVWG